ncbi:MAG: hypothetical protein KAH97_05950 [Anaerolineales bacterium]|nr:hypothetical protein [Anaerolineales bacterium]
MKESSSKAYDQSTVLIRRIARILSLVILGIAGLVLLGHLVVPETNAADYPFVENLLPVILGISILGLAIAWRWEGTGGAISVGFFLLHLAVYWVIRGYFFPIRVLVVFSPILITGVLFLVHWRRSKNYRLSNHKP